jgi:hypothetical protein
MTEKVYDSQYINELNKRVGAFQEEDFFVNNSETEIKIKADDKVTKTVRKEIVVLNENGRRESELVLFYDSFIKIEEIKASIYSVDGVKIKDIDADDIRDLPILESASSFGDSRIKYISFNHNKYPYIIAYEYEESSTNFLYKLNWTPEEQNTYTNSVSLRLEYPKGLKVNIKDLTKSFNLNEFETKKSEILEWKKSKGIKNRALGEGVERVLIQPLKFNVSNNKGSFKDWESFGHWYHTLNQGRQELSDEKKKELDKILAKAKTRSEKIETIYNHLQENSRYISIQLGIGGWQTFPASFVEKNGYGDCKALTNFTFAMYEYAGIEAYPVLINSGLDVEALIEDFPSNQFNHVILYLPNKGDEIWLECTSQIMPFNYITSYNANRYGLKITNEGGELIKTPSLTSETNYVFSSTFVSLEESNNAVIQRNISKASGEYLEKYYFGFANKTEQQKVGWLNENFKIKADRYFSIETSAIDRKENPVSFSYSITTDDYFRKSGDRIFFSTYQFKEPGAYNEYTKVIYYPSKEVDSISVKIPVGYKIEVLPKDTSISNRFVDYSLHIKVDTKKNILSIIRTFILKKEIQSKFEIEELQASLKRIDVLDEKDIIFKKLIDQD